MKSKLRAYYFMQTALLVLLSLVVFEILRSLPYSKTWKELGESGFELSIGASIASGVLNMAINSTNFFLLKTNKRRIAFDFPSIIWLVLAIAYLFAIHKSAGASILEYLPILLCLEPILYNQGVKLLLSNPELH